MLSMESRRGNTRLFEFPNENAAASFKEYAQKKFHSVNVQFPYKPGSHAVKDFSEVLITMTDSIYYDAIAEMDLREKAEELGGAMMPHSN